MSLQGTLDSFKLSDVLRLLASTGKTGRLEITGDRGTGQVWVTEGEVVLAEATAAPWAETKAEVIFELFRYKAGDFIFDDSATDIPASEGSKPDKVEPLINAANNMLKEWNEIEKVVPSLASPITLAMQLPEPLVEINEASWDMIVGIGSGTTVGDLGDLLQQSEIVVSRNLKQLIEVKLVDIEYADPILPGGTPLYRQTNTTPQVKTTVKAAAIEEDDSGEVDVIQVEEIQTSTQELEDSSLDIYDLANDGSSPVATEDTSDTGSADWRIDPDEFAGSDETITLTETTVTQAGDSDVDLDNPEHIAEIIESMPKDVIKKVTKAVRADDDEMNSILGEIRGEISDVEYAAVTRFLAQLRAT